MQTIWPQLPVPIKLPKVQFRHSQIRKARVVQADIAKSRTKQTILETVHILKQATAEQIVRLNWSAGYLRDI